MHVAPQGGTTLTLHDISSIEYVPLRATDVSAGASIRGVATSLHARLRRMLQEGELRVQMLCNDCTLRCRTLGRIEGPTLALSHTRGMASIATKARRVVLLDLEEESSCDEALVRPVESGRETDVESRSAKSEEQDADLDGMADN